MFGRGGVFLTGGLSGGSAIGSGHGKQEKTNTEIDRAAVSAVVTVMR